MSGPWCERCVMLHAEEVPATTTRELVGSIREHEHGTALVYLCDDHAHDWDVEEQCS